MGPLGHKRMARLLRRAPSRAEATLVFVGRVPHSRGSKYLYQVEAGVLEVQQFGAEAAQDLTQARAERHPSTHAITDRRAAGSKAATSAQRGHRPSGCAVAAVGGQS